MLVRMVRTVHRMKTAPVMPPHFVTEKGCAPNYRVLRTFIRNPTSTGQTAWICGLMAQIQMQTSNEKPNPPGRLLAVHFPQFGALLWGYLLLWLLSLQGLCENSAQLPVSPFKFGYKRKTTKLYVKKQTAFRNALAACLCLGIVRSI